MKKWIVESTHLRMLPEMEKPEYEYPHPLYSEKAHDYYYNALASQSTIKRGDNGQWKEGDVLTEGVDFEKAYQVGSDLCKYTGQRGLGVNWGEPQVLVFSRVGDCKEITVSQSKSKPYTPLPVAIPKQQETFKTKNMKSGVELIAEERKEQIEKHGFNVLNDTLNYKKGELKKAALYALTLNERYYPKKWGDWFREKIARKTLKLYPTEFDIEMLIIAGALIAAEIDRLNNTTQ